MASVYVSRDPVLGRKVAVTVLSAAGCLFIMRGLPPQAWERFGYWLVIGLVLYFVYGFKHSTLRADSRAA